MAIGFLGRWLARAFQPESQPTREEKGAEPDDAESQFNLGQYFAGGAGAVPNHGRAAEWYQRAAAQGHCAAQFSLGLLYGQGQGVVRNQATAGMWLKKAAESGHAGAQYHLGVRQHRASKSGRRSESSECRIEALKWLELAVAQGYRGAESARQFVSLGMTREEVDEGVRRALAFAPGRADMDAPAV